MQQGYTDLSGLYGQGRDSLASGYGQGISAINSGYGQAGNLYNGLINSTAGGASAYGDASGANGAGGLQRATDNFKNSGQYGAYGFSLGQGLQALDRTHAAAGNLNSGNADADTLNYATGLAGQQYNSYVQGLSPYLSANAGAVGGAANVAAGQGNALGSAYQGQGTALNSSYQGQGAAANANQTGQGASDAAATMNNYNVGANQLNALFGLASLATGAAGAGGLASAGGAAGSAIPGAFGATSFGGPGGPSPLVAGKSLFSAFA